MTKSFIFAVLLTTAAVSADDWPQWGRTNERNMRSPETGLPDSFDPGKFKLGTEDVDLSTTKNVKWVAKLGSQSFGNVTVAGGKVFVGSNNDSPRDPQHQGDRSILMCFNERTGEFLWQLVVPKLASGKVNDWENLGILSSPTIEGDRVYLVTSRCEVMCLTVNGLANGNTGPFTNEAQYVAGPGNPPGKVGPKDADIVWRYDMMNELGVFPHNASDCDVLSLDDDELISSTSNGQDWTHSNIPSPNAPTLIALDKKTGKYLGEDDAHIGPRIFHGTWCSPSAGKVNGKTLVFFGGPDGFLYAFDPKPVKEGGDLHLKKVWWCDANPPEYRVKNGKPIKYPSADGPSEINATPVFYKNRVYVAIGQDPEHGEGLGNLICVDPTQTGDITKTGILWSYNKIHRSLSTCAITPDGLLFIGDFSGFVHCLDAETGKVHWVHDLKSHIWGSPLFADGKVYIGAEDGTFAVFTASKEKKLITQIDMGAPVYSTPVVANGKLFVQTTTHLYAISAR
jgi:outer membrane protein assembly factor BamB